jgi:hypothetical protein
LALGSLRRHGGSKKHAFHELTAIVLLGGKSIVRAAAHGDIGDSRRSAERVGVLVMKLETARFPATLSPVVEVGAPVLVALRDCAAYSSWNVATRGFAVGSV